MTAAFFALGFALLGLLMLVSGLRRLRKRKVFSAGARGTFGVLTMGLGALVFAVSSNLYTYARLTSERTAAELRITQLGDEHYSVVVEQFDSGVIRSFDLRGNEWQVDARILKWHGIGTLLGLDSRYRLERLSGRYSSVERERTATRTVHALSEDAGLDVWTFARRAEKWLPLADANYGSAAYLPLSDGAVFQVTVSQTGLVARPVNDAARDASAQWN